MEGKKESKLGNTKFRIISFNFLFFLNKIRERFNVFILKFPVLFYILLDATSFVSLFRGIFFWILFPCVVHRWRFGFDFLKINANFFFYYPGSITIMLIQCTRHIMALSHLVHLVHMETLALVMVLMSRLLVRIDPIPPLRQWIPMVLAMVKIMAIKNRQHKPRWFVQTNTIYVTIARMYVNHINTTKHHKKNISKPETRKRSYGTRIHKSTTQSLIFQNKIQTSSSPNKRYNYHHHHNHNSFIKSHQLILQSTNCVLYPKKKKLSCPTHKPTHT